MATTTKARNTRTATPAEQAATVADSTVTLAETRAPEFLVEAFQLASEAATTHAATVEQATRAMFAARIVRSRMAYRLAAHPDVLTAKTKKAGVNITAARTMLGLSVATGSQYVNEGKAMGERVFADDVTDEDITAYNEYLDATERQRQKDKRAKAKAAAAKAAPADKGEGNTEAPAANDEDALTFSDVIRKANELLATAKMFEATGEAVEQADADRLEDILSQVSAKVGGLVAEEEQAA